MCKLSVTLVEPKQSYGNAQLVYGRSFRADLHSCYSIQLSCFLGLLSLQFLGYQYLCFRHIVWSCVVISDLPN